MPTQAEIEAAALAVKECTDGFDDPVHFYVDHEAQYRWEKANPDGDWYEDGRVDDLDSYRIIARAALDAAERVRAGGDD